jgi:hypothetical protein
MGNRFEKAVFNRKWRSITLDYVWPKHRFDLTVQVPCRRKTNDFNHIDVEGLRKTAA